MPKHFAVKAVLPIFLFIIVAYSFFSLYNPSSSILSPIAQGSQPQNTNKSLKDNAQKTTFGKINHKGDKKKLDDTVKILLLGLDARLAQKKNHCDAIHMIVFDLKNNQVVIHPISRGATVDLEGVEKERSYLANICAIYGYEAAQKYIESMLGVAADYTVKIGFSQAIGIFRKLGLEPYDTLKFIRNRRYNIGDHQRSYNQALFLKDSLLNYFSKIASLPRPILYILYKTVDTDMPFETALELLNQLAKENTHKNQENVKIIPFIPKKVQDIHYLEKKSRNLNDNLSDIEFTNYQNKVKAYLKSSIDKVRNYLEKGNKKKASRLGYEVFQKKAWLQLENTTERLNYHFETIKLIYLSYSDRKEAENIVFDFYTQMKAENNQQYLKKSAELLGID